MDSDTINNALLRIQEADRNLDKLHQKQSYLDKILDGLLNYKKDNLISSNNKMMPAIDIK